MDEARPAGRIDREFRERDEGHGGRRLRAETLEIELRDPALDPDPRRIDDTEERVAGSDGNTYVWLEEIVRSELGALFPGQKILESAVFRVARDAEMDLDDEGGMDYLQAVEEELRKRRRSQAVRGADSAVSSAAD